MNIKHLPIIIVIPIVIIFLLILINNNEVNRIPGSEESDEEGVLSNMGTDNENLFNPEGTRNSKTVTDTANDTGSAQNTADTTTVEPKTEKKTPESNLPIPSYLATLKTSEGDIVIKLNDNQTPKTVKNFVKLARQGFYNGTIFHRVMENFMIQGGDPKGDGTGGPGYKFDDETFTGEYTRGTVAMANSGPNTNGSQFFIIHKDYPLPKSYVIFGKVTQGLEVLDKIATAPVERSSSGEISKPVNPVTVKSVEILED
jgi:cyclophilin family peptidyl-prolyl cis-trans isomerase